MTGHYPKHMEQGRCANCGSGNVCREGIEGGGPGENILVFFFCGNCGCEFIELYEYTCKGIIEEEQ